MKLMSLRMVPEDELEEISEILNRHNIDYYHTPEGAFGVSAATLWLEDKAQFPQAQQLLADYQKERVQRAQQQYARQKAQGETPTLLGKFMAKPLQVLLYMLAALFFVYLLFVPVWDLQ